MLSVETTPGVKLQGKISQERYFAKYDITIVIENMGIIIRGLLFPPGPLKSFLKGKATVNAQANINLETLKPLLTPVPSLSEQKKIASIVSSIESKVQLHKSLKDKIRSLKAGLMQQILTGKIRVKT